LKLFCNCRVASGNDGLYELVFAIALPQHCFLVTLTDGSNVSVLLCLSGICNLLLVVEEGMGPDVRFAPHQGLPRSPDIRRLGLGNRTSVARAGTVDPYKRGRCPRSHQNHKQDQPCRLSHVHAPDLHISSVSIWQSCHAATTHLVE